MGLKLNIIVFVVTIIVTLATTAVMCLCVVTDYWEIVSYPLTNIKKILNVSAEQQEEQDGSVKDVSVETLHEGKVILIQEGANTKQIMVQMHAGLWSMCYDVAGDIIILNYAT